MFSKGETPKTATKSENICRRLQSELGNSIRIVANDSGELLLVPDSLLFTVKPSEAYPSKLY